MSHHPTIQAPLNDLVASLVTAGTSLAQAAVALFHLVLAFGYFWFHKFVQFAQTVIQLGFELFRGVAGFVIGMSSTMDSYQREALIHVIFGSQFLCVVNYRRRVLLVVHSDQGS
jgi:hypothetical protein